MADRDGPTTAKREQVQADVLAATEELLATSTYADLNVEKIATASGISRTAFYFYFRDKREVLLRLATDVAEELYARASTWFEASGSEEAEMRDALRQIGELYDRHATLLRAVTEVATYDEEIAQSWRALLGRFVEATERRLEAEPTGARPARAVAFALVWGTERAFYQQLVQDQPVSRDELLDGLLALYQRAL